MANRRRHPTRRYQKRHGAEVRTKWALNVTVQGTVKGEFVTGKRQTAFKIYPVDHWAIDSTIQLKVYCAGAAGTDMGFAKICQDVTQKHCLQDVHFKKNCTDCDHVGVIRLNSWCPPTTVLCSTVPTEIAQIEISGFEAQAGVNTIIFEDKFVAQIDQGRMRGKSKPFNIDAEHETEVDIYNSKGNIVAQLRISNVIVNYSRV